MNQELSLRLLPETFTLSKLPQFEELPRVLANGEQVIVVRTDDELAVLCPDFMAPTNVQQETGWRCFRLVEAPGYNSVGVVASLTLPLTQAGIPFLVHTTFSYVLVFVMEENVVKAVQALQRDGIKFVHEG